MIGVTWTCHQSWTREACLSGSHLDMLSNRGRPEQLFATRREAEAFIASELRKCSSGGRNSQQGYWWGFDYERPGIRVRFEMFDEPGSRAIFGTAYHPPAPI